MIKEFVSAWEKRKSDLENYFRKTPQGQYDSYETLVKLIFQFVINAEIAEECGSIEYDINRLHVIDDGDYQGTLLFIIPKDMYQPSADEYVITTVSYGSCSGCDTLLKISGYEEGMPNEQQVKDYMTLCLHLLQHMKTIYKYEGAVE